MKYMHQIVLKWTSKEIAVLKEFNINMHEGYERLILEENETYWQLKPFIDSWGATDLTGTDFSDQDLKNASFLMALPNWQTQYPQPEAAFGYLNVTYNLDHYCSKCGIGARQIEPFRLKKEPKWGRKKVFILFWVHDEFFVEKGIYEKVFHPLDIESMPVLLSKNEKVIESTVQLIIPEISNSLKLENYKFEICDQCKRKKYFPIQIGYFPTFQGDVLPVNLVKSKEYYGSGAMASKWILISNAFRSILVREQISMSYYPMEF